MSSLSQQLVSILQGAPDRSAGLDKALHLVLAHFKSETGTIHVLDHKTQMLHLAAQSGLPPALIGTVRSIPVGKGIAGETAARGGPVTMCNLQTDASGVARPGARATGVGGALCVPLRKGNEIVGTIGVGTIRPCEYTPQQTAELESIGRLIGDQASIPRI